MTFKSTLALAFAASATGLLISVFAFLPLPFNALVGLLAAVIAIWFFRNNETRGRRIAFVIWAVVYFLFFTVLVASVRYRMGLM
ncbi:hypothetical protein QWJ34_06385 [Saccharibacillus sp. CPCC 101409]|uniref:hypothetical protein n=1 Tax=Saccharibacillus sp. CPCC 101409 TaxID=3058041 RepID=UPI002671F61E|nr:hypothetical protein [Saccharibacillus sp. CPCC 101409]MDO3409384.1 hypothetical protein [Saccharibacillus sp. CPCC 101409]